MDLQRCPDCDAPLDRSLQHGGATWICIGCNGHSVGVAQLRKLAGREVADRIWQGAGSAPRSDRRCPSCAQPMSATDEVDVCTLCYVFWLDDGDLDRLRPRPDPAYAGRSVEDRVAEIMTQARLDADRSRLGRREWDYSGGPDHWWQWVLGILGMPLQERELVGRAPIATWSVAAAIIAVSVVGFQNLGQTIETWGLIPAEADRMLGLTAITSFFVHGGPEHLIGNLYFLLVFGQQIEMRLGAGKLLAVLAAATLIGDASHLIWDPRPDIPVVGASGGIVGLMAFFALSFPRERFRLLIFFRWVSISAVGLAGLYLMFDLIGLFGQLGGWSAVSSLAHLGGAAGGVGLWLAWRTEVATERDRDREFV